ALATPPASRPPSPTATRTRVGPSRWSTTSSFISDDRRRVADRQGVLRGPSAAGGVAGDPGEPVAALVLRVAVVAAVPVKAQGVAIDQPVEGLPQVLILDRL